MLGLRNLILFFLILTSTSAFAESYRLNADYFVRGSADFGKHDHNKVGVLKKGARFEVMRTIHRGGAELLKIHVINAGPGGSLRKSKEYWIYKSKDSHFTELRGPRSTEAGSTSVPCRHCGQPQRPTPNASDLGEIATSTIREDNVILTPNDEDQHDYVDEPETPSPVVGDLDQKIRNYSSSDAVDYTIKFAIRNKYSHSHGKCYRKVKDALAAHPPGRRGLIPGWYSGVAARTGKEALKKYGFVNLMEIEPYKSNIKKPSEAPKGAVLVYSSGKPCRGGGSNRIRDCGHIEIKTGQSGNNAYVSDYSYPTGINETPRAIRAGYSRYKLIGVMIKP